MPKVIRTAYHPAHGGPVADPSMLGQAGAEPGQPTFASAPRRRVDPAPSRWSYRLTRLMLTPFFRFALWAILPVAALVTAAAVFFADETRRTALMTGITEIRESIETRPEFMVQVMRVQGASDDVVQAIHDLVQVTFPISSFDLNLTDVQNVVTTLNAVERAQVRVQPGGTLLVQVTERVPAVIWRSRQGLILLDEQGVQIAPLRSRGSRPDLGLIAGHGADQATEEALALLAAAQPLKAHFRGLVRVGERRWDVVLTGGQKIMLPVEQPVEALERVIAMDTVMDVLARDVAVVDLRLGHRPTLRLRENAVEELQRIRAVETQAGEP